ncbi:MAG: glycosyltransferase family 39 protein [Acidobacteriaceae bacterium]|nr:glycosyltransferase family 39 protein [Acidobacteriaceae bacterium]
MSLDPPTYHLLSHFSMDVFGRNAYALRLPALCGFLLLEWAIFSLVRRIASERAALVAMLFPTLTASFRYASEGRPYGWLLGLYAAALACWFAASQARDAAQPRSRLLPLLGLGVAILLAITSHYFGVLILVPVTLGELVRVRERRRFDWPVLLVGAGALIAGIVILLPFQKALAPYRAHYYITTVSVRAISQGFRELFVHYNQWPLKLQHVLALLLLVATIALLAASWKRYRARPDTEPAYLWASMLGLAALPFFSFLFGRFVTHTMEVRYVIAAVIPFLVAIALLLERRLQQRTFFYGTLAVLILLSLIVNGERILQDAHERATMLASFEPSPLLHDALAANPTQKLYTQSLNDFFLNSYYMPDRDIASRLSLVYDEPREVHWLEHNTNAVTAIYMQHYAHLDVTPYCSFLAQPHALLLFYNSGWEWIGKELNAAKVPQSSLGITLRGALLQTAAQPCTSR